MFNPLFSIPLLFLLSLFSFFVLFTIRQLFIKRAVYICLYHICLFCVLFIASVGGGGVQNADYERLEKFILLEKNNQLEEARKNPEKYDAMLRIDLQQFKNSKEFNDYIKKHDLAVDRAEAIFIGWIFVLVAEISAALTRLLGYISIKIRCRGNL